MGNSNDFFQNSKTRKKGPRISSKSRSLFSMFYYSRTHIGGFLFLNENFILFHTFRPKNTHTHKHRLHAHIPIHIQCAQTMHSKNKRLSTFKFNLSIFLQLLFQLSFVIFVLFFFFKFTFDSRCFTQFKILPNLRVAFSSPM